MSNNRTLYQQKKATNTTQEIPYPAYKLEDSAAAVERLRTLKFVIQTTQIVNFLFEAGVNKLFT